MYTHVKVLCCRPKYKASQMSNSKTNFSFVKSIDRSKYEGFKGLKFKQLKNILYKRKFPKLKCSKIKMSKTKNVLK